MVDIFILEAWLLVEGFAIVRLTFVGTDGGVRSAAVRLTGTLMGVPVMGSGPGCSDMGMSLALE